MVINHLLTGMILQVPGDSKWPFLGWLQYVTLGSGVFHRDLRGSGDEVWSLCLNHLVDVLFPETNLTNGWVTPRCFSLNIHPDYLEESCIRCDLRICYHHPTTANNHQPPPNITQLQQHEPPTFVDHKTPGHEKVDAFGAGESCDGWFYLGRATWKHQSLWTLGWWLKFHGWAPQK